MNKKAYFLKIIGLVLIFVIPILLTARDTINAQDTRIVRIYGGGSQQNPVRLEPKTLLISKDTVVVWSNFARLSEVKIIFEDGKSCSDCTKSPCRFSMSPDSCYITSFVGLGETSSLRFVEKGTFSYKVTGGAKNAEGKIIVQ